MGAVQQLVNHHTHGGSPPSLHRRSLDPGEQGCLFAQLFWAQSLWAQFRAQVVGNIGVCSKLVGWIDRSRKGAERNHGATPTCSHPQAFTHARIKMLLHPAQWVFHVCDSQNVDSGVVSATHHSDRTWDLVAPASKPQLSGAQEMN